MSGEWVLCRLLGTAVGMDGWMDGWMGGWRYATRVRDSPAGDRPTRCSFSGCAFWDDAELRCSFHRVNNNNEETRTLPRTIAARAARWLLVGFPSEERPARERERERLHLSSARARLIGAWVREGEGEGAGRRAQGAGRFQKASLSAAAVTLAGKLAGQSGR